MTVVFPVWNDRKAVAEMLEAPVRQMLVGGPSHDDPTAPIHRAYADLREIIAELDRMDTAVKAKRELAAQKTTWERYIVAKYVSVTDAPEGTMCSDKNGTRYWRPGSGTEHRAKVLIDGVPYCGTHRKRPEEQARYKAISTHRAEYVPDPALQAIVDADRALYEARRNTR